MKRSFRLLALMLGTTPIITSCSDSDPQFTDPYRIIDFENTGITLAGPTSYGENLYESYDGTRFTSGEIVIEDGVNLQFGINPSLYDDEINFWSGGMVLSQWNYRSNPADKTGDWWMSYQNQCSVYNTASTDGANSGAGVGDSNTFAVINGYQDNNSMSSMAHFSFSNKASYVVESIEICPPSYLYGTIEYGNTFGSEPLKSVNGWFKIMAYGFDAEGNPTNGGNPVEKYICDYRDTASPQPTFTTWRTWNLSMLGRVNTIKFQFEGSDKGAYGLNTPAYMCIDNIKLRLNP